MIKTINTVDLEMFARTQFSLIFANSLPREFKVLANIANTEFGIAILVILIVAREFKKSQIIRK